MRLWLIGLLSAGLAVSFIAAAAAGIMSLRLYAQWKLALAEPVYDHVFIAANRRVASKLTAPGVPPRIILIGDSHAALWSGFGANKGWEVINRGIGGETTAQLAYRFHADATELDPDLIVLQAGSNDLVAASLASEPRAEEIVARTILNLKQLAKEVSNHHIPLIITTAFPPGRPSLLRRFVWNDRILAYTADVNSALLAWQPSAGIQVLDLAPILGKTTLRASFQRGDGRHLNEAGYDALNGAVEAAVAALLKEASTQQATP
jgi:lysophospholipase L1-like esterase